MKAGSHHIAFALAGATLLLGCGASGPTVNRDNMAYLYGKGADKLSLEARVYHHAPQRSTIYYKVPTQDLLYKGDGNGGPYRAMLRVTYEAFPDWSSRTLLDSASTTVQDKSLDPTENKELIGSIDLRRNEDRPFVLKVTARDLNRESQAVVYLQVEPRSTSIAQYFVPLDPKNSTPMFTDHFGPESAIKVRCDALAGITLRATHHPADATLPAPVFSSSTGRSDPAPPDSSFTVTIGPEGTFTLGRLRPGFVSLQLDTGDSRGYTLFVLTESYPYVGTATDMLKPLRYITSNQEFDRISKSPNVRKAIEQFWIDAAGDRERARDIIRIYYDRVENANRHFTSVQEGWRTDRGLVHIIFGTPSTIHKSETSETWIYGEENNLMSTSFTFVRRNDPFSRNDLVLERDPMLKGAWYRNVESWRNGRVYQN